MVGSSASRVEVGSAVKLAPKDTVLLGTDGLFDNLHIGEIVERLRLGSFADLMNALAEACRARMLKPEADHPSKPDDLTVVAFRLKE